MTVTHLAMVAAVLLTVSGCQSQGPRYTALLGVTAPFSGTDESVGRSIQGAVQLAVDDRNARGGAGGYNGAILALDDGNTADMAARRAGVMVPNVDVIAVLGGFDIGAAQAAAANYGNANVPFLTLSGAEPLRSSAAQPVFRLVATDSDAGRLAGQFATARLGARRVAILSDSAAGLDTLGDAFAAAVQAGGASIVQRARVERPQADFADTIRQVGAASPDLIFFAGRAVEAGEFLKQARLAGIGATFLGGPGVDDARFVQTAGPAAQSAYYVSMGFPLARAGDAALRQQLSQAVAGQDGPYTALAYDATSVLLDAVARAVKAARFPTRPAVAAALRTTKLTGVTGDISFDDQGNRRNPPLGIYVIRSDSYPGELVH